MTALLGSSQGSPGHRFPNAWLIVPNDDEGIRSYQIGMVLNPTCLLLEDTLSKAKCNLFASVSLLMKQEQLILAWQ